MKRLHPIDQPNGEDFRVLICGLVILACVTGVEFAAGFIAGRVTASEPSAIVHQAR